MCTENERFMEIYETWSQKPLVSEKKSIIFIYSNIRTVEAKLLFHLKSVSYKQGLQKVDVSSSGLPYIFIWFCLSQVVVSPRSFIFSFLFHCFQTFSIPNPSFDLFSFFLVFVSLHAAHPPLVLLFVLSCPTSFCSH